MKEFKIRCSAIGQIMTDPKSVKDKENGVLSKGAQSYCDSWLMEQLYCRKQSFASKYTEKGNIVEDESIDFAADMLGYPFLLKNEQYFEDEFMTGTPDLLPIGEDLVIDMKNSWSWETFPYLETEIPNNGYYWQLQGYMNLASKSRSKLLYTLMDTPVHLIEKEAYIYCRNNGYDDLDIDIYKQFEQSMTYGDIPNHLRIKGFDIQRSDTDIDRIKVRVEQCRAYISDKLKQINY